MNFSWAEISRNLEISSKGSVEAIKNTTCTVKVSILRCVNVISCPRGLGRSDLMLRITNDFAASSSERGFKYQWLKKRSNGFRKLWQNFINIVVPWRVINLFSFIFYLLIILLTLYGSVQCSKANQFKSKGWLFAFDLPRSWTTTYFLSVYEEQVLLLRLGNTPWSPFSFFLFCDMVNHGSSYINHWYSNVQE